MKTKFILLLLFLGSCSEKVDRKEVKKVDESFVKKPIMNLDIEFQKYTLDAEKGDKIVALSGSFIEFPPNAFIDRNGELIKGMVDVSFREFHNSLDLFISGIPMQYDTLGSNYTFESSAMCEIYASQNNIELFVNPNAAPEVHLITNNTDPSHNLYFLDTIQKTWIPIGKSKIEKENIKISESKTNNKAINEDEVAEIVEPIKANPERPIISVTIPYVDFVPELQIFKNTKFEVDLSESNYDPKDGDIEWDKVKLEETNIKGLYNLIFSSRKRKISYRVKPVYEGEDYDDAYKIYKDKISKIEAKKQLQARAVAIISNRAKTFRMFNALKFGIYNCDKIIQDDLMEVIANFVDQKNNQLDFYGVNLMDIDRNAIFWSDPKNIKINQSQKQAIIVVKEDTIYYVTPTDFGNTQMDDVTKSITFKMRQYIGETESPDKLKELLEI
jgi:hypothetical protein